MGDQLNWAEIQEKLPYDKTEGERTRRKELWKSIDVNDNGYVSLAETQRGIRDVLQLPDVFDCVPAMNQAFFHAKTVSKVESEHGPDYLTFPEFRIFLFMLRQFFEYYQAFDRVDVGDDNRISKEEFTSPAMHAAVIKWIGPVDDMNAEFDSIDQNGGGQILFSEFVDWALKKNLDIEDDNE